VELISTLAKRESLMLEFCRLAAEFSDKRGYEGSGAVSAIEWLAENCHMTEEDAAGAIAVGRRLISPPASRVELPPTA
jgi:hypothetical protein